MVSTHLVAGGWVGFEAAKGRAPPLDAAATKLRGRPYLIDSVEAHFPERLNPDVHPDFPKVFLFQGGEGGDSQRDDGLLDDVAAALRKLVDEQLLHYGALVVRGLPMARLAGEGAKALSLLMQRLGYQLKSSHGTVTRRTVLHPFVYPASEEDPQISMDLHQDLTFLSEQPHHLFFYYEQAAREGGLNPLLDVREYAKKLPAKHAKKFEELGIRYETYYPDASHDPRFVPWQMSYGTNDRKVVEAQLVREGFEYMWDDDGGLRRWNVMPPFKRHPVTGQKLWVNMIVTNHASYFHDHPTFPELKGTHYQEPVGEGFTKEVKGIKYPFTVKYGDGSVVPYPVIQELRTLAWETARGFKVEDGDILVLDNYITQHGRFGYVPPRKVWYVASMGVHAAAAKL